LDKVCTCSNHSWLGICNVVHLLVWMHLCG